MTMYTQTDIRTGRDNLFGNAFSNLQAQYGRWRMYVRTRNELMSLSNRELADLGMTRSGIKSIALEAAYGNA
ncbi:DUF1127 domain-containing protein [Palleronia sp. LCG004]|uniref:DUF1127 domain-containing protein n=1 Tax=Palleronia sp. LCG004 TaxID=3079304 RepID=UPI002942EC76|nr:DUF1127 domain-containing protein [Palleronia sp. LCG004]WOI55333.1 DUF1127 domain-containing protein [Palleronia sp. LCG004]